MRARPPLFTRTFVLTAVATLAFFCSLSMQLPIFPDFLRERAGSSDAMIGVFIGAFSITALLLRPAIGRALENGGRIRFLMAGGAISAGASIGYALLNSIGWLLAVRLFHGIAVACYYTAASTLVADGAPDERRGEALSYFSMMLYLGFAIGPAAGLALREVAGFSAVFGVTAALGGVAIVVPLVIREPPLPHAPETIEIERRPLLNRAALFPAGVLLTGAFAFAAAINFSADYATERGIDGRGLYFPAMALTVIVTRVVAGRLSDRYGRVVVAAPGLALVGIGMFVEAAASSIVPLVASAILFGAGFGALFPTLMAFAVDRVPARERGSAMATYTAAIDLGIGAGAPLLGAVKGAAGYPAMYVVSGAIALIGVAILLVGARGPTPASLPLPAGSPEPRAANPHR
jgi:MFS family permease